MTAIDTIDGVVMVYAYSIDALPENKWRLFDLNHKRSDADGSPVETDRSGRSEGLINVSIFLTMVSIAVAWLVAIIEVGPVLPFLERGRRSSWTEERSLVHGLSCRTTERRR